MYVKVVITIIQLVGVTHPVIPIMFHTTEPDLTLWEHVSIF